MLKALELLGFKSFADKTRLEFPRGITAVVGPNGSGKSNVVDAIKWVLGEQSVKSLRGREMADVIFNGSGTRRALNSAEITLTLDNADHRLAIDTQEVHLTRRVYRSGEGEYLINRQPCRLRDIRDLLSGTGMGTEAYSVIEQGKVDVLLQSSAKDRRIIFEEAAGISRFKSKKLEALRRLDRVQQNLLRLSDIVEEVDSRLRNVRSQAAKARRYKEYSDRLQQLRTHVGLVDWRRLTERLESLESECRAIGDDRDGALAAVESLEAQLLATDGATNEINETLQVSEAQIAANRERIAAAESTVEHERDRSRDLDEEIARHRRQLVALSARAGDLQQQMVDTGQSMQAAELQHRDIARRLAESERDLTEVMAQLDRLRSENQQRREALLEQMRQAAALGNEISRLSSELAAADATRQRASARAAELETQRARLADEIATLRNQQQDLARGLDEQEELLAQARIRLQEQRQAQTAGQQKLSQIREHFSRLAERASLLEELEKRQEGLSAGVKEVLVLSRASDAGPFRLICGLVADLFQVPLETAPLVEVVLGPASQYLVAPRSPELLQAVQSLAYRLTGRVGFLWLEERADHSVAEPDLQGRPGVLARVDQFVQTEARFVPLARRLLGRTWVVERLEHAWDLVAQGVGPVGFVTLAGEYLAPDGTLVVGPRQAATGIISRRSELRSLQGQMQQYESQIQETQAALARGQQRIAAQEQQLEELTREQQQSQQALADNRLRVSVAEQDSARLDEQRVQVEGEWQAAQQQHASAAEQLAAAQAQQQAVEAGLAELQARLAALTGQVTTLELQQRDRAREATETKVELAKSEERLGNLRTRLNQFEESQQERQRAILEGRQQLSEALQRGRQSLWNILHAEMEIADLYLRKERFVAETADLVQRRAALQQQRGVLMADAQRIRGRIRKIEEKLHTKQLEANEVRHERSALADRLREDYGVELAAQESEPTAEEQLQRDEVQQEIDDLRRKINHLGNVNLEALEELDQLDTRYQSLSAQYQDLTGAKAALEKIIEKINVDSRRLFVETLQTVREHFQTLFRDLFGGGRADIVLEEGEDILETGIEIVARPPGKEPRSISLLSGGEKTMTCVALLLAIFRSRPSPFCVLDEVDAALDEANIDRFTKVLQDFLKWTQFIIVTHSKKTMTCANQIYGVTMQESGVSKQVSVRFEDVSDDGHISQKRLAEAEAEEAAQARQNGQAEEAA